MKHSILGLCALTALSSLLACGGISDPSHEGENVTVIQGALTSSESVDVPANTHVAIVWLNASTGQLAIGADAPVVNGKFAFKLAAPSDAYFAAADFSSSSSDSSVTSPGSSETNGGNSSTPAVDAGSPTPVSIRPLDNNVSGSITSDLKAAKAGFVVYVDQNGNGKLDLDDDKGSYQSSPDQVIGGSSELALVYLKGGGNVDYEKLRDKTGVKPAQGFNLAVASNGTLWLSANDVSLKIGPNKLPESVCSLGSVTSPGNPGAGAPMPLPSEVICSADGRTYTYKNGCGNTSQPTEPEGLCYSSASSLECMTGRTLQPGDAVPSGWPCSVTNTDQDGGPAPNTGSDEDGGAAPDTGSDEDAGWMSNH